MSSAISLCVFNGSRSLVLHQLYSWNKSEKTNGVGRLAKVVIRSKMYHHCQNHPLQQPSHPPFLPQSGSPSLLTQPPPLPYFHCLTHYQRQRSAAAFRRNTQKMATIRMQHTAGSHFTTVELCSTVIISSTQKLSQQ